MQVVAINWRRSPAAPAGITPAAADVEHRHQNWPFYYALSGLLALSLLLSWWIRRTKFGMGLVAIREDEDKAATIGIDHAGRTRCSRSSPARSSSAWPAASTATTSRSSTRSGCSTSCSASQIMLSLLLGGRATLWGPVLGAFIIEPLNEYANNNLGGGNTRLLLFGGLLALVVAVPAARHPPDRSRPGSSGWRARGKAGLVGRSARPASTCASERLRRPRRPALDRTPLLEVKGLREALRRRCGRSTARRSRSPRARSPR